MKPKRSSMVGALFAVWLAVPANAWVLPDTKAIADAAAGLNTPGSCQSASDAFAAPGGHVWLVARDLGYKYVDGMPDFSERLQKLTCKLVDRQGVQVGRDVTISIPGEPVVCNVAPLASLHDGSVVVGCDVSPSFGRLRLVRIDTTGVLTVSGSVPQFILGWDAFIDQQGLVHVDCLKRGVDYMQINTISPGMPTVKELKYSDRFGTADSAPFWMRWKGSSYGRPSLLAGCDEDLDRIVVATRAEDDSFIRICRFDTKTLKVLDSGLVYPGRDTHHVIQDSTIWRLTLVPSDSGGFWLFIPGDMLSSYHPGTVRVYHLSRNLSTLRPAVVGRDSVRPFRQAPEGSLLAYRLMPQLLKERYSKSGYSLSGTFGLYFTACGPDGRLYETREERNVELSVSK